MRKHIDRLLEVLIQLDDSYDFLLVISGHGSDDYERYLQDIARPLTQKGKVKFVGFLVGEELRNYYNAADLFVNSSASEGGPVSAMKALACETPLFSTDSGNVAERIRDNGTGLLVGAKNYNQWKEVLEQFLAGKPVKKFDRAEAEGYFDWQKLAAQFSEIYHQLSLRYGLYESRDRPSGRKAKIIA